MKGVVSEPENRVNLGKPEVSTALPNRLYVSTRWWLITRPARLCVRNRSVVVTFMSIMRRCGQNVLFILAEQVHICFFKECYTPYAIHSYGIMCYKERRIPCAIHWYRLNSVLQRAMYTMCNPVKPHLLDHRSRPSRSALRSSSKP